MPKPEVNVATAQPKVEVSQPKPNVEVAPAGQPNVALQQAPPQVHYERAQPKVVINQAKGQPQIHVEGMNEPGATNSTAPSQQASGQQAAANNGAAAQPMRVDQLLHSQLKSTDGQNLGTVQSVVTNTADGSQYIVLGGQGGKEVLLPVTDLAIHNGQVVAKGVSSDRLSTMPTWNANNHNYRELTPDQTLQLSRT
jgi:hypothetical protein